MLKRKHFCVTEVDTEERTVIRSQDLDVGPDRTASAESVPRTTRALSLLQSHGERLALADVADELAVCERDAPLSEIPGEFVLEVYCSLYHDHVPRLEDLGLVSYDQETDTVAPTETLLTLESGLCGD